MSRWRPRSTPLAAAALARPDRAARGRETGNSIVSERLTDILACPVCKGPLAWQRDSAGVPLPRGPARLSGARRHPGHAAGRGAAARAGRQRAREPLAVFRVVIPARHASTRLPGKPLAAACRRADDPARAPPRAAFRRGRGHRRDRRRAHPRRCARLRAPTVEMTSADACVRHRPHRRDRRPARLGGRRHRRQRAGRRAPVAARADRAGGRPALPRIRRGDRDARDADRDRGRVPRSQRRQGRDARRRDGALLQPRADSLGSRWRGLRAREPANGTAARGATSDSTPTAFRPCARSRRHRPTRSSGASGSNSCARSRSAFRSSSRMRSRRRAPASTRPRTSRASRRCCAGGAKT